MSPYIALSSVLFLLSGVITKLILVRAIRLGQLDKPNERSSHAIPTPRGGGLSFVIATLCGIAIFAATSDFSVRSIAAVAAAGIPVAFIGFLDDRGHVSNAIVRLVVHGLSAGVGLYLVGWLPMFTLLGTDVNLSIVGNVLAIVYIVWLLNLFNFMDGIDGIAAIQTVTTCLGVAVLAHQQNLSLQTTVPPVILAGSVLGFLLFNFPPAKIFMGDSGSGFLGVVLAVMSLISMHEDPRFFWVWIIMLGVFIVDATVTLLRRLVRGERPHVAHRSHAYQHLALRFASHRRVTLGVLLVNLAWLFPLALTVASGWLDGSIATLVAYVPLIFIALRVGAGTPQTSPSS